MKIILAVFLVAIFSMSTVYATTSVVVHLDNIFNIVRENNIITFSGQMTTFDGAPIANHTIFIENDAPLGAPDVILGVTRTDNNGKFSTSWNAVPSKDGDYDVYAVYLGGNTYGYARSETSEIYVKPSEDSTYNQTSSKLPAWLKEISKMWHDGEIQDKRFAYGIENLIDQQMIREQNQTGSVHIPQWVKNDAGLYEEGKISDDEFLNAIQYLIDNDVLRP